MKRTRKKFLEFLKGPGCARSVRAAWFRRQDPMIERRETWGHRAVYRADGPPRDHARAATGDRHRLAAGAQEVSRQGAARNGRLVAARAATRGLLVSCCSGCSPAGVLFGHALDAIGIEVIFTWKAVVIAMMVISFPLVARSARAGIEQVDRRYEQIAATLGAGALSNPADLSRCRWHREALPPGAVLGLLACAGRVRRDDHGRRVPFQGRRGRWPLASIRWWRPDERTRRGACSWSRRCSRLARFTCRIGSSSEGPAVIDLSIDITLRQDAFVPDRA